MHDNQLGGYDKFVKRKRGKRSSRLPNKPISSQEATAVLFVVPALLRLCYELSLVTVWVLLLLVEGVWAHITATEGASRRFGIRMHTLMAVLITAHKALYTIVSRTQKRW